jgi:hypothetical protein
MTAGRKPKPTALKLIQGVCRPNKANLCEPPGCIGSCFLPQVPSSRLEGKWTGSCMALTVIAILWFWDNFFDPSDNSVFEHDFDAMRMLLGICEDSLDDAFCEFPAALMLLFHHTHLHSRLDLRSILAIHAFIMVRVMC